MGNRGSRRGRSDGNFGNASVSSFVKIEDITSTGNMKKQVEEASKGPSGNVDEANAPKIMAEEKPVEKAPVVPDPVSEVIKSDDKEIVSKEIKEDKKESDKAAVIITAEENKESKAEKTTLKTLFGEVPVEKDENKINRPEKPATKVLPDAEKRVSTIPPKASILNTKWEGSGPIIALNMRYDIQTYNALENMSKKAGIKMAEAFRSILMMYFNNPSNFFASDEELYAYSFGLFSEDKIESMESIARKKDDFIIKRVYIPESMLKKMKEKSAQIGLRGKSRGCCLLARTVISRYIEIS